MVDDIEVLRYRYAPGKLELLSESGGMENAIKNNPLLLLLVPVLVVSQVIHIAKFIKKKKPDLIHAHWLFPQVFCAVIAKKIVNSNTPILCTSHGGDLYGLKGVFFHAIKQWALKNVQHISVVSEAMKQYINNNFRNHSIPIDIMPMGTDLTSTFSPKPETSIKPGKLFFVGRLVPKKGVDKLINAMPALIAKDNAFRLYIAGSGPELPKLKEQVKILNILDHIVFLGSIPHNKVACHFVESESAVFPFVQAESGDMEGLGLVVIEAMGCKCPVVVGDVPAIHDTVEHMKTGILCKPDETSSIVDAISLIHYQPEIAISISEHAYDQAHKNYSWPVCARKYQQIINNMITSSNRESQ